MHIGVCVGNKKVLEDLLTIDGRNDLLINSDEGDLLNGNSVRSLHSKT